MFCGNKSMRHVASRSAQQLSRPWNGAWGWGPTPPSPPRQADVCTQPFFWSLFPCPFLWTSCECDHASALGFRGFRPESTVVITTPLSRLCLIPFLPLSHACMFVYAGTSRCTSRCVAAAEVPLQYLLRGINGIRLGGVS